MKFSSFGSYRKNTCYYDEYIEHVLNQINLRVEKLHLNIRE